MRGLCALQLALWAGSVASLAQESNAPAPAPGAGLEETNTPRAGLAVSEIERRLVSNEAAIEQNSREAREAAARNAELLSKGLTSIEEALAAQREAFSNRSARELEVVQNSNRATLLVGGTFAAVVSLAMLLMAWFQWRMSRVWSGISALLPPGRGAGQGRVAGTLSAAEPHPALAGAVADSNRLLLGALGRLEHRLQELEEHSAPAPSLPAPTAAAGNNGGPRESPNGAPNTAEAEAPAGNKDQPTAELLAQGRALLRENLWEAAIKRFDEVLSVNPKHGEALVRKGAALEKLLKFSDAIECYDRAIASNAKLTIAYMHKGGLCNRLERFKEALDCYEKALRTHEQEQQL